LQAAHALGVQGVAAPSANRFGRVSPTTAAHVLAEFPELDDLALAVLDGGPCDVGIESTIVDATRGQPVLLRPGMVTLDQLQRVCGCAVLTPDQASPTLTAPAPKASGTLESHYAPRARVRLVAPDQWRAALPHPQPPQGSTPLIGLYGRQPVPVAHMPAQWLRRTMPNDSALAARELFAVLRELDDAGVSEIWIEAPPPGMDWDGVRDRLSRAAA
jgi:L-threonylcarbamoyladenylate synthase